MSVRAPAGVDKSPAHTTAPNTLTRLRVSTVPATSGAHVVNAGERNPLRNRRAVEHPIGAGSIDDHRSPSRPVNTAWAPT